MKNHLILCCLLLMSIGKGFSQILINPTGGLTLAIPNNMDNTSSQTIKAGWLAGLDVRLGHKVYFQPGAYFIQTKTGFVSGDAVHYDADYVRSSLRLKALMGFDLIHRTPLKLRLNAGPSYDILVNVDDGNSPFITKDNSKKGAFNLQGGLGIDVFFLSLDVGYWHGMTKAFDEGNARFSGLYFNLGFVFGRK